MMTYFKKPTLSIIFLSLPTMAANSPATQKYATLVPEPTPISDAPVMASSSPATMTSEPSAKLENDSYSQLEVKKSSDNPYSQLISFTVGPYHPQSVSISNGSNLFNYNDSASLNSFLMEAGWSAQILRPWGFGTFYFSESLAFTRFAGKVSADSIAPNLQPNDTLSVFMLGLDTRLSYALDWFPWKALIPFVDGGYQYTFYNQSGPSDVESAQGGVGNFVAGAGIRLWINRGFSISSDSVNRYASIPIFLTFKANHIFPQNGNSLNLGGTSYMGGLSFGL